VNRQGVECNDIAGLHFKTYDIVLLPAGFDIGQEFKFRALWFFGCAIETTWLIAPMPGM
jgi:hypothetical protein